MEFANQIRAQLKGDATQNKRRDSFLTEILKAFGQGGQEILSGVLNRRMAELERHFDEQLKELHDKL